MKLIQTIKNHLPVSRKTLDRAHQAHEMDKAWLLTQLKQATRANVHLERQLHQAVTGEE